MGTSRQNVLRIAHKSRFWYHLEVSLEFSEEHLRHFYMDVSLGAHLGELGR